MINRQHADQTANWQPSNLAGLQRRFEESHPSEILRWGCATFGDTIAFATGFGPSGVVLMDLVARIRPRATFFYLDTHLLFPETYALRDALAERLGVEFVAVHPDLSLADQRHQFGPNLWQRSPDLCCRLRKVNPLHHFLRGQRAWVTAIRRDQGASRARTAAVAWDEGNTAVKICPLINWTHKDIWKYIFQHELPYNPLLDQGYKSIGCVHCTRPVATDADERAGRWVGFNKTECGIHGTP